MFHHVARSRSRELLFRTWPEGCALWSAIARRVPGIEALCLMPDHLHLLARQPERRRLGRALQAYAQWRNHRRGTTGVLFERQPDAVAVVDAQKRRRSIRYVHLNPCRAGLVADPLAWPLSTHRDMVGLVAGGCVALAPDPHLFHAYVSADPSVHALGSTLPLGTGELSRGEAGVDEVLRAVSDVLRVPMCELSVRGPARNLALKVVGMGSELPVAELAPLLGVDRSSLYRHRGGMLDDAARRVFRVVGDGRFGGLPEGDLRRLPSWRRYSAWR